MDRIGLDRAAPLQALAGPSVFIMDDEPRVRDGLKNLLRSMGWAIAGGGREALAHANLSSGGVVLLDLALDGESGLDLIGPLRNRGLAVLVCSLHEGAHTIRRALEAGANGYLTKREAANQLRPGMEAVLTGAPYLSPRAAAALEFNPP
jgi:DNA-binding NarL/FixJ family response regulator